MPFATSNQSTYCHMLPTNDPSKSKTARASTASKSNRYRRYNDPFPKTPDTFGRITSWTELISIYFFVIILFYDGFRRMIDLSNDVLSQSTKSTLKSGWIPNRRIDLSDGQWSSFRRHLPEYLLFAICFVIASRCCQFLLYRYYSPHSLEDPQTLTRITRIHSIFYIIIGVIFNLYLHGTASIMMLLFLSMNYLLCSSSIVDPKRRSFVWTTWIFNLCAAFTAFHFDDVLSPKHGLSDWLGHPLFIFLDEIFSAKSHWNQSYRFAVLRTISFNLDLHYRSTSQPIYKCKYSMKDLLDESDFGVFHYFGYILYTPLGVAGPILSFHEWIIQNKRKFMATSDWMKPKELSTRFLTQYAIRLCALWLIHEVGLHFIYCHYIKRYGYPSDTESRGDYLVILAYFSYFHLKLIWLKFSILWKYHRLWALCDGVVTEENMKRCISTTTSVMEFWRYWHSTFNLWLVRYLYIPMGGGRKHRVLNMATVFMFVFLWHGDFEPSLLYWSLLMVIGMTPEILCKRWALKRPWIANNKYMVAAGAAVNIIVLIIANNIGFGAGWDHTVGVLHRYFVLDPVRGIPTFLTCYLSVVMVVIVMYHTRYLMR